MHELPAVRRGRQFWAFRKGRKEGRRQRKQEQRKKNKYGKDATSNKGHRYWEPKLLVAPGLATSSKKLLVAMPFVTSNDTVLVGIWWDGVGLEPTVT